MTNPEEWSKPVQEEIDEGLKGVAQAVVNIWEGHTTIETGSALAKAFDLLLKPENANVINAVADLHAALIQVMGCLEGRWPNGVGPEMIRRQAFAALAKAKATLDATP